ncbi:hypothetical protein [Paraburkholderia sp. RL17-347-BIC-D]|jgi:hypothetical protein|uniref:hypothetical protein n=1 Tax=Paraburkholderia sp. RL17-347-BIC-D TaxID=3031632 RepID=UPI0038BB0A69
MNLPKATTRRSLSVIVALVACVHMNEQVHAQTPAAQALFMLRVDSYSDRAANNRAYEDRQYNNRQYFNRQYENRQYENRQYENRQYENRRYNNQLYNNEQDQTRLNGMVSP